MEADAAEGVAGAACDYGSKTEPGMEMGKGTQPAVATWRLRLLPHQGRLALPLGHLVLSLWVGCRHRSAFLGHEGPVGV